MPFSVPAPASVRTSVTVTPAHRLFDQLAAAEGALAGYSRGHALHAGNILPGGAIRHVCFAEQVEIECDPAQVLDPLIKWSWPASLDLVIHPMPAPPAPDVRGAAPTGVRRLTGSIHSHAFLSCYENVSGEIKTRYGTDQKTWPQTLRFAWIVRNAFGHGGKLTINDLTVSATWRGVALSHTNNGEHLMYNQVTAGDTILLMLDVEDLL